MDGVFSSSMLRHGGATRRFDEYYRCYPVAMMPGPERENVNHGGKVIMPPSALDKLTRLHITYPMLFELHNGARERLTHAGVLEFIAEEGKIYLPFWVRLCTVPWTLLIPSSQIISSALLARFTVLNAIILMQSVMCSSCRPSSSNQAT